MEFFSLGHETHLRNVDLCDTYPLNAFEISHLKRMILTFVKLTRFIMEFNEQNHMINRLLVH